MPGYSKRLSFAVAAALAVLTSFLYLQVRNHEFVTYDDDEYIIENTHIQSGFNFESVQWAFTTGYASNWHPLTWLTHIWDYQLYGLRPAGHHLTNVLFHVLNTVMLFVVLGRMTGRLWESAFVAAVFALHPLHVESVAWTAERKDVLSAFFWITTIGAYGSYTRHQNARSYFLLIILFALGLMAKPMLVTLPFVLLLLDYWPLGRFRLTKPSDRTQQVSRPEHRAEEGNVPVLRLLLEKVPLFLLAAVSGIVTFLIQQHGGAMASMELTPFPDRIANALVNYVKYIFQTLWPSGLAVMYPYPGYTFASWQTLGACIFLANVTWVIVRAARQSPYLLIGWLWYLGSLVPVIGLIRVGAQSMADRYMYIPMIGLLVMAAWGASEFLAGSNVRKVVLAVAAAFIMLSLGIFSTYQLGYWKDSVTLFKHTLAVTEDNAIIHNNLGVVLARQGHFDEAASHFTEAVRINPGYTAASENLHRAQERQGMGEAMDRSNEELRINPNSADAYFRIGNLFAQQGKDQQAIEQFDKAIRLNPNHAEAHNNIASLLAKEGKTEDAIKHYKEALKVKPDLWNAHYNLGLALVERGKIAEAIPHYYEALRRKPNDREIRISLAKALKLQRKQEPAP